MYARLSPRAVRFPRIIMVPRAPLAGLLDGRWSRNVAHKASLVDLNEPHARISRQPKQFRPVRDDASRNRHRFEDTHKPNSFESSPNILYGVHPCACALATRSRQISRIYVESGEDRLLTLLEDARKLGIPITRTDKSTLGNMCGNGLHQGIVMHVSALSPPSADESSTLSNVLSDGSPSTLIVALDEISDPQNVGAILRSAYLFNIRAVLLSERNSAPLNATVSKASSGALECLAADERLLYTRNMAAALAHFKDAAWQVLATDMPSKFSKRPSTPVHSLDTSQPTLIVFGSEGKGVRATVKQMCTGTTYIPHKTEKTLVDSLNVSVAAAIFMQKFHAITP